MYACMYMFKYVYAIAVANHLPKIKIKTKNLDKFPYKKRILIKTKSVFFIIERIPIKTRTTTETKHFAPVSTVNKEKQKMRINFREKITVFSLGKNALKMYSKLHFKYHKRCNKTKRERKGCKKHYKEC